MRKEWKKPELENLKLVYTNETKCYCENGIDDEVITYKGGNQCRPGHNHKPHRPGKPCPERPVPNPNPDQDQDKLPLS